jgi:N-acetylmuramoyl-L-alanine amidase
LAGKKIAIDPGHGGHDPGALGRRLGLQEKDVTLAIALELRTLLEEAGVEVFMTRSTDTLIDTTLLPGQHIRPDLWMRRDIVHEWSPDFFISIHINSWKDSTAAGIETYYNRYALNGPHSRVAAQLIQDRLVAEIARRDRGVKYKESSDAVLRLDDFPAVLAEILFVSNPVEERILADPGFAPKAAKALFLGIQDYFNTGGGSR